MVDTFKLAPTDAEIRQQFAPMSKVELVENLVAATRFVRELIVEGEKYKMLAAIGFATVRQTVAAPLAEGVNTQKRRHND